MFRVIMLLCALVAALPGSYTISVDAGSMAIPSGPVLSVPAPTVGTPVSRVIEPVVFSAVRASEKTRKSVSKIVFDSTVTDIGFGWYPNRSEFVCFYPGAYYFSFTALSDSTSNFKIALMKNNDEVVYAWGERVGYQSGSNSAILTLEKNDRVYLSVQEGTIHETKKSGRGYTSFSGFRVY